MSMSITNQCKILRIVIWVVLKSLGSVLFRMTCCLVVDVKTSKHCLRLVACCLRLQQAQEYVPCNILNVGEWLRMSVSKVINRASKSTLEI